MIVTAIVSLFLVGAGGAPQASPEATSIDDMGDVLSTHLVPSAPREPSEETLYLLVRNVCDWDNLEDRARLRLERMVRSSKHWVGQLGRLTVQLFNVTSLPKPEGYVQSLDGLLAKLVEHERHGSVPVAVVDVEALEVEGTRISLHVRLRILKLFVSRTEAGDSLRLESIEQLFASRATGTAEHEDIEKRFAGAIVDAFRDKIALSLVRNPRLHSRRWRSRFNGSESEIVGPSLTPNPIRP